jgi:hypothetical protein
MRALRRAKLKSTFATIKEYSKGASRTAEYRRAFLATAFALT